jgi:hypothetical protein
VQTSVHLQVENWVLFFTSIIFEAMPFIILGALIAGLLEEFVPQRFFSAVIEQLGRSVPRRLVHVAAIMLGGLLGLIFPMCECGIIPVMRRLIRKGLPLSCCICYLLAGPIVNGVVLLSTYVAFTESTSGATVSQQSQMGPVWMVVLRAGVGYLVAVGTSLVVEWQYQRHGNKLLMPLTMPPATPAATAHEESTPGDSGQASERRPWRQRLNNITETALHDFVDIMVFLILGAFLAASTRLVLQVSGFTDRIIDLSQDYPVLVIGLMMGLAVLLCLCSEADAFVAASFRDYLPSASLLSFLVLGPMLDLKLYVMYTRIFRPRLIWTIILSVVVQVLFYCVLIFYIWRAYHLSVGG